MWTLSLLDRSAGHTLHYHNWHNPQGGRGTLLFIPGLGGSVTMATPFLQQLQPYYRRVVGLDLRTFGQNKHLPAHKPQQWLDDLQSLLHSLVDTLDDEPVHIAGISLGGVLATQLVHRCLQQGHPRPERLLLLSPAFTPHPKRFPTRMVLRNTWRFLLGGPTTLMKMPYGASEISRFPDRAGDDWNKPLEVPIQLMLGVKSLAESALKLAPRLHLPVMVVVPQQDSVCDPKAMATFAQRLPETLQHRLLVLPEAYHDVLLEPEMPEIAEAFVSWANLKIPVPV